MIPENFLEQAALYAAGVLPAAEREQFGMIVESYDEVRALVRGLEEVAALAVIPARSLRPAAGLKERIFQMLDDRAQQRPRGEEGFVITCRGGFVQWVNPAFTAMCGYSLAELHGKKLGPILQGEKTDRTAVARMRAAVHEQRACHEKILNYHKDGGAYWVEIALMPIADETGATQWFIARERELPDLLAA